MGEKAAEDGFANSFSSLCSALKHVSRYYHCRWVGFKCSCHDCKAPFSNILGKLMHFTHKQTAGKLSYSCVIHTRDGSLQELTKLIFMKFIRY